MKKPSKKHAGIIYVYHHVLPGRNYYSEYSHPELRIMFIDPAYPTCTPGSMIDFTAQCDNELGHTLRKSYSLHANVEISNYHAPKTIKFLSDLGFNDNQQRPCGLRAIVKKLRDLGIPRYTIESIPTETYKENREFVPRKFKRCAALYWQALEAGKKLS